MHPYVEEALRASIQHWRENAAAQRPEDANLTAYACALCRIFNPPSGENKSCFHPEYGTCPVKAKTGSSFCYETPYYDADRALGHWIVASAGFKQATGDIFRHHAQRELEFLQSLLPADQRSAQPEPTE